MSLDDECPTQYFGADRVELTIQGKEVSMSKGEYFRLTEKPGALTEDEMLTARIDGLSLADILTEANTKHRNGCASSRNRSCTCEYLAQWDQPALAGPGILVMPDGMVEEYLKNADISSERTPIVITESEYAEHINFPERSNMYRYPLPAEFHPADLFAIPGEVQEAALPPIIVDVEEQFDLRRPRNPIIHWRNVPKSSMETAIEEMVRNHMELLAKGIEPRYTLNGKPVDLSAPIERDHP